MELFENKVQNTLWRAHTHYISHTRVPTHVRLLKTVSQLSKFVLRDLFTQLPGVNSISTVMKKVIPISKSSLCCGAV